MHKLETHRSPAVPCSLLKLGCQSVEGRESTRKLTSWKEAWITKKPRVISLVTLSAVGDWSQHLISSERQEGATKLRQDFFYASMRL